MNIVSRLEESRCRASTEFWQRSPQPAVCLLQLDRRQQQSNWSLAPPTDVVGFQKRAARGPMGSASNASQLSIALLPCFVGLLPCCLVSLPGVRLPFLLFFLPSLPNGFHVVGTPFEPLQGLSTGHHLHPPDHRKRQPAVAGSAPRSSLRLLVANQHLTSGLFHMRGSRIRIRIRGTTWPRLTPQASNCAHRLHGTLLASYMQAHNCLCLEEAPLGIGSPRFGHGVPG